MIQTAAKNGIPCTICKVYVMTRNVNIYFEPTQKQKAPQAGPAANELISRMDNNHKTRLTGSLDLTDSRHSRREMWSILEILTGGQQHPQLRPLHSKFHRVTTGEYKPLLRCIQRLHKIVVSQSSRAASGRRM